MTGHPVRYVFAVILNVTTRKNLVKNSSRLQLSDFKLYHYAFILAGDEEPGAAVLARHPSDRPRREPHLPRPHRLQRTIRRETGQKACHNISLNNYIDLRDVFAGHASIYSWQFPMLKFFRNGGHFLVLAKPCHVILISVVRIRSGR